MELTDAAIAEFREKLERSIVDRNAFPYIFGLEKSNYEVFDNLVMLMLVSGEQAFIYGFRAVIAMDPTIATVEF